MAWPPSVGMLFARSERSALCLTLPRVHSILSLGEDAEGVAGQVGPVGRALRERGRGGRSGDPCALVAPPHVRESPAFRYVLRRAPADRLVRRSRADPARAAAGRSRGRRPPPGAGV